mgnify:CR=1 FL=1
MDEKLLAGIKMTDEEKRMLEGARSNLSVMDNQKNTDIIKY